MRIRQNRRPYPWSAKALKNRLHKFDLQKFATGYIFICIFGTGVDGQEASTDTSEMVWFSTGRLMGMTVTVQGLESGGSISIRVKNLPSPLYAEGGLAGNASIFPGPTDQGVPLKTNSLNDITADGAFSMGGSYAFVSVIKTAGGDPTPTFVNFGGQVPQ